jgi:diguanylate cyclase (GGDEF)-like protein
VDDDPIFLSALHPMLEPWGIKMTGLENPLQFWDVLENVNPDLLILDVEMPQMSGIEICQAVRNNEDWQGLPILFLTAHREFDTIQQIFAVGADDYIVKPVVGSELLTRIVNRWERNRWLQRFYSKDPLTGLNNQPHSSREIEKLIQESEKNNSYFCLVLLMVEDLRQINIEYGHGMGNQVLQEWGRIFQCIFSNGEVLGYWGNGEFAIAIPGLQKSEVVSRLDELLIPVRTQIFTAPDSRRFQVNYRVAVAEYPLYGLTLHSLYRVII